MKEGYLYLVVANGGGTTHFFQIGQLVEGTGRQFPFERGVYDYTEEDGTGQWMRPHHVVEIGKI